MYHMFLAVRADDEHSFVPVSPELADAMSKFASILNREGVSNNLRACREYYQDVENFPEFADMLVEMAVSQRRVAINGKKPFSWGSFAFFAVAAVFAALPWVLLIFCR